MTHPLPVSAILLTYNEEINLPEALDSIKPFVDQIIVVDSHSNDGTRGIAERYSAKVYVNAFVNQAKQFLWALQNADIANEWILRVDADERWSEEGFQELGEIIKNDSCEGVYVKMKIYFMGRWMRHGGLYPNYFLRVFKKSRGTIEDRWMDEHIRVEGKTVISGIDVIESNYDRQKNIALWTEKHNKYSTREAVEFLISKYNLKNCDSIAKLDGNKTERKRWLKENFYFRFPLFLRSFLYYVHRYILSGGFLDGTEGFIYHFLQAFWYRFLVDAKICQIERLARSENKGVSEIIREHFHIEI